MTRALLIADEVWPLARPFQISRGAKTEAKVVVAEIHEGETKGRGECVPYARYQETVDGVVQQIKAHSEEIESGADGFMLRELMPAGAARNALDCATWDLQAKLTGKPVWELLEIPPPAPCVTATTIGLGPIEEMALQARKLRSEQLIKVKLDQFDVIPRMEAIRAEMPSARIIIDPNEGWTISELARYVQDLKRLDVEMIEQPVLASEDSGLVDFNSPIPICADESCHTVAQLNKLLGKYDMINIKLDKTGGLTEALSLIRAAQNINLKIMIGCMIATSLAMAPALLLGNFAEFVDLDGPLLLKKDRASGMKFGCGLIYPSTASLWG